MKGDFTRFSHQPRKHYAAVLMQQGRVQLDADWNEQFEIEDHRWRVQTIDAIGACGVPIHTPGFGISPAPGDGDLLISPGRMYVDGLLCELDQDGVTYVTQPDYPAPVPPLNPVDGRTDLIYLDVWQRLVTAVEDPKIREVALGGPDTTTRVQTICQVKVLQNVGDINCPGDLAAWDDLVAPSAARMSAQAAAVADPNDPCLVAPGAGYRGLENRLYRVEVHDPGALGTATFKWSRDNGSLVTSVENFIGGTLHQIQLGSLGRDQVMRIKIGDWVEVLSDKTDLDGVSGTMAQITDIDEAQRVLSLSADVSAHANQPKPRVRRWDQATATVATAGPWMDLEDGVQVGFSGGPFKSGDYWLIPARTATGDVEGFLDAPPRGIEHHYCRLALVTWHVTAGVDIRDCRPHFPPLTELPTGGANCCTVTVGDGVNSHGDTTDIQTAVDQVIALERGGRVCILPGEYQLNSTVIVRGRDIIISGCGRQAIIIGPKGDPVFAIEGTRVSLEWLSVAASSPEGAIVVQADEVQITGNRLSGGGLWVRDGSESVQIESNEIVGGRGPGIALGGLRKKDTASDEATGVAAVEITNNHISGMESSGITTLADRGDGGNPLGDVEGLLVAHNRIVGCALEKPNAFFDAEAVGGIVLREASHVRIHANHIADNGADSKVAACGVFVHTCVGLEVSDNEILNNGSADLQAEQCIDFTTMQAGEGLNPRTEQGVLFEVSDASGEPVKTTDIQTQGTFTGLDCGSQTEITLPSPVSSVNVTLVLFTAPSTIEAFNVDGSSAEKVTMSTTGQAQTFTLTGTTINRVVITVQVFEMQLMLLLKFCFGSGAASYQAGMVAMMVIGGDIQLAEGKLPVYQASPPAALISDNVVVCPRGQALIAVGIGPISVSSNTLTSQGMLDQPFALAQIGRCVFILDLGRTPVLSSAISRFGFSTAARASLAGSEAFGLAGVTTLRTFPDGRVLFHGNQVALQIVGETPVMTSAVTIASLDDVSLQDNQILTETARSGLLADVLTLGATVRASSNRFTELPLRAWFSYFSSGLMNIATDNQATHCIQVGGSQVVETGNQVMITTYCNLLKEVFSVMKG